MNGDWVGQTFNDRYEILELLGTGGMSSVYKATDPNLNRVVAIKIIHKHLSVNADFLRRFSDEATAVAQLRHPHIVQVFDFDTYNDTAHIVFEFVPGENLQERFARLAESDESMPLDETIRISKQITQALDYAHSRGLVHRDVKPANIILDVHGNAFLADFGIVKIADSIQHTVTGAVIGTARYMSPEQIRGSQIDGRSDLYSLGVTMYEMASGSPPFRADSAMTLMMMHVSDPVPDMDAAGIPAPLGGIIERALAKDPEERFLTARDMSAALGAIDIAAPPPPTTAPLKAPIHPKVPRPVKASHPPSVRSTEASESRPSTHRVTPKKPAGGTPKTPLSRLLAVVGAVAIFFTVFVAGFTLSSRTNDTDPETDGVGAVTADEQDAQETVAIRAITVEGDRFIVDYETMGYTEALPGNHVHFYWNTVSESQSGVGANEAEWFVWGGPPPFSGYRLTDQPETAQGICAVVANADHTIRLGTGNCVATP
jgi:serine/threonine protein kinase